MKASALSEIRSGTNTCFEAISNVVASGPCADIAEIEVEVRNREYNDEE
jgi:hypothetical protein